MLSGESRRPLDNGLEDDSWLKRLEEVYGEFTSDAKALWEEASTLAPEAFRAFKAQAAAGNKPKPSTRLADDEWDYVVRGADLQSLWVKGRQEQLHHKAPGGRLENFKLRAKDVDPESLGVDKVKQYSGYLDDDETDKHLFFCES